MRSRSFSTIPPSGRLFNNIAVNRKIPERPATEGTTPGPAAEIDRKIVPLPTAAESAISPWSAWRVFCGLLWCEWYAHGKLMILFLAAWLASVWVLPMYVSPVCVLFLGALFAIVAGPAFGGSDTGEGCEEFTFSLPPTRAERYLARLAVGGGALLLLTLIDLLALGLDLPQILAKLYVGSGLIRPWPVFKSGLLYGLVLMLPVTVFSISFVISAITHSRAMLVSASLWAVLISLAALRLGFWYESLVWENLNGWFSCPLLAFLSVATLWGGYVAYQRKEVGHHAAPIAIPARWWLWIILFAAGLVLALTLAASLARHYPLIFN
jgi:hypothetical protein